MNRLFIMVAALSLCAGASWAQEIAYPMRTSSGSSGTFYQWEFNSSTPTGGQFGVSQCPVASISFEKATTADVTVFACPTINPTSSSECVSKRAFTTDDIDGATVTSGAPYLVPFVISAETSGTSRLNMHCTAIAKAPGGTGTFSGTAADIDFPSPVGGQTEVNAWAVQTEARSDQYILYANEYDGVRSAAGPQNSSLVNDDIIIDGLADMGDRIEEAFSWLRRTGNIVYGGTIEVPSGSYTTDRPIVLWSRESADHAGAGIYGVTLRGQGDGFVTQNGSDGCATSIRWLGPAGEPMIVMHGARMSSIENICFIAHDGTALNASDVVIEVTADSSDGEVSLGTRIENVGIYAYSTTRVLDNAYTTTGIRLSPDESFSATTDAQIDSFVIRDSWVEAHIGAHFAQGADGGVSIYDTVFRPRDYAVHVEDSDFRSYNGYIDTYATNSQAAGTAEEIANKAFCDAGQAAYLIGSTSMTAGEQPKDVAIYNPRVESDCGGLIHTVQGGSNVRNSSTVIVGGLMSFGDLDGATNAIDYRHDGSFSILGTVIGIRGGATAAPINLQPATGLTYNFDVSNWENDTVLPKTISEIATPRFQSYPGNLLDIDGNGKYEYAIMQDWDGDGSTWETCTAKDTPSPICKVAGEQIYRDFADDLNCALYGCAATSNLPLLEPNATLHLEPGVFVNFPCWRPGGTNDPSDPTTHDTTGDAAYSDCPVGENSLRRGYLTLAGTGVQIVGSGRTNGETDTATLVARGYGRTDGTYIVNDMGNIDQSWFGTGGNQTKPFVIGYPLEDNTVLAAGTAAWFGDVGGWSQITSVTSPQDIYELPDAAGAVSVCVCTSPGAACTNSSAQTPTGNKAFGIQSIDTDTHLLIRGDINENTTKTVMTIVSPLSNPPYVQGSDCDANSVSVPIGVAGHSGSFESVLPSVIESIQDGATASDSSAELYILRPDYFNSSPTITAVSFEPQDYWNEDGGDCSNTGIWQPTPGDPSTDDDCDTRHYVNFFGHVSQPALDNVTFRYWHNFGIDGDSLPSPSAYLVQNSRFEYGNGASIMDPGYAWKARAIDIAHTRFDSPVIATFGMHRVFEDIYISDSTFPSITTFADDNGDYWRNIYVSSSMFTTAFNFNCGARNQRIDNLSITGRVNPHPSAATMLGAINIECDEVADPAAFIYLNNIHEDPPGSNLLTNGNVDYTNGSEQVLVRVRVTTPGNSEAVGPIFLSNSGLINSQTPFAGDIGSGCLIAIEDRSPTGLFGSDGTGEGELDVLRKFYLSNNAVYGELFCQFGAQGAFNPIADTSDSPLFDAHRAVMRSTNYWVP